MKYKIIGISIIVLLITAVVLPTTGTDIKSKVAESKEALLIGEIMPKQNPPPATVSITYVDDDYGPWTRGWGYDHFDNIHDGIDAISGSVKHGKVYVFNGIYQGSLVVNKSIDMVGEDKENTIIDGGNVKVIANYVKISGFTIKNGYWSGINLAGCSYCIISDNIIRDNGDLDNCFLTAGIESYESSFNTIVENIFIDNIDYNIMLMGSIDLNYIYHNNFHKFIGYTLYNAVDWDIYGDFRNVWNDSYPSGGNYWDDHPDPHDDYIGENQDIYDPNGDGIIDRGYPEGGLNPYIINVDVEDKYPWIDPLDL